jgi:hypothetical protein
MSNISGCRTTASEPSAHLDAASVALFNLGRPA